MLLALALLPSPGRGEDFLDKAPPELEALSAAVARERARPAPRPSGEGPWVLRVLTYNIHGILPMLAGPGVVLETEAEALSRYREIARRLREQRARGLAPHLVAIQEAWNVSAAKAATEAGYPFVVRGGSARFGKLTGSGIFLLSEFPVLVAGTLDYEQCAGWDCVATKGALHARVVVPGLSQAIDVYTTHMNADGPPAKPEDSRRARMSQIQGFADFVRRTRDPALPVVMAADFNFTYPAEDAALFERLVGATNVERDCGAPGACTGDDPGEISQRSLDHQFHLPGLQGSLKPAHLAQTFREPYEGKPLSDHWGLEARYLLLRPRSP